jgi:ABC-2 type transport system permease protein
VTSRLAVLAWKEMLQLLRDRATLAMLLGIPLLQIVLFGCAIELNPSHVSVELVGSNERVVQRVTSLMRNSGLSLDVQRRASLAEARAVQWRGEALLVIDLDARPVHVYLDATDPVLAAHARAQIDGFVRSMGDPLAGTDEAPPPVRIEDLYNPGARTQPFILTGLLGLILTMTLIAMSALSLARERERGTLENLLVLRTTAVELAIGKLAPYLLLAMLQAALVLAVTYFGFRVPQHGSLALLAAATLVFAAANLSLGFAFSALARQQLQAMQLSFFYFLPSALLSGFMFPFAAMPGWAQAIGEWLPLTHYLRIVRGVALRAVDFSVVGAQLMPIVVFTVAAGLLGVLACRLSLRQLR